MESVPVTCCGCDSRVQWSDLAQHWEVKRAEAGSAVVPRCKRVVPRCKRVALRCIVSRRVASCCAALQRVGPRCNVSCRVANVSCRVANVSCCQAFCTLGPASEAASLIAADVAALKAAAAKVGEHTRNGGQLRLRTASNLAASVQPRSHATDNMRATTQRKPFCVRPRPLRSSTTSASRRRRRSTAAWHMPRRRPRPRPEARLCRQAARRRAHRASCSR